MITKDEIKKSLPHGSLGEIAKKAGVSKVSVTRYFNGSVKSSPKIEKAALEYAIEYHQNRNTLANQLKDATN